ncbi:hypothetical protein HPB50_003265 [Hyalomma asiaticum]|uniref:Uncharacterized protein n=1 Tax=Hyalomma asiaticum TaxID=266040 RepID=A0ACB7RXQ4_HYAAI|nr:hypothetical protein HPB50_003265 [Hyalomma asiaticum]
MSRIATPPSTVSTTTLELRIRQTPRSGAVAFMTWFRIFVGHAYLFVMGLLGIIILPVLVLSSRAREVFFAFVYMLIQRLWGSDYGTVRRVVMTALDDLVSHDTSLRERDAVRVLEVGAAYGPNLPYVRRNVEYWRLEPNVSFDDGLRKNLDANHKVFPYMHDRFPSSVCSAIESVTDPFVCNDESYWARDDVFLGKRENTENNSRVWGE